MPTREPELTDFAAWAKRLRKLLKGAADAAWRGEGLRPAEKRDGVLKYECYRYFRRLRRRGALSDLAEYVGVRRDPTRWYRHQGTSLDWVLRLIEPAENSLRRADPNEWVTAPTRMRVVLELNFADRCDIHPDWLLPFLYEAGSHEMIREAAAKESLPGWANKYREASRHTRKRRKKIEQASLGNARSAS